MTALFSVLLVGAVGLFVAWPFVRPESPAADVDETIGSPLERQKLEAQKQEREAKSQTAVAHATNSFLVDMLGSADPQKLLGDKVTVV